MKYPLSGLAWFDSLTGMIPCKVLGPGSVQGKIRIKITANRPPHKRGEVFETISTHVVPRTCWRASKYEVRRIAHYMWE